MTMRSTSTAEKDKFIAYTLLWVVPGLGLHNFYLGKKILGTVETVIGCYLYFVFLLAVVNHGWINSALLERIQSSLDGLVTPLAFVLFGLIVRDVFVIPRIVRENAKSA